MLGRMLHPYELSVPDLGLSVPVHRGGKWTRQPIPTPAILTSSWQSPAGRIGHLFVNISETRQPLAVSLDTRNVPAAEGIRRGSLPLDGRPGVPAAVAAC